MNSQSNVASLLEKRVQKAGDSTDLRWSGDLESILGEHLALERCAKLAMFYAVDQQIIPIGPAAVSIVESVTV